MAVERKYALSKLGPGDYLLPGNDGVTIWRLNTYEDGPSHGRDPADVPTDRTFWEVRRWTDETGPGSFVDTQDWDRWECVASSLATRRDAVEEALTYPTGQ